ncbi:unnamed protein product, partial [marine sediment metagenome]
LRERIKKVKNRLENIEEEPLISDKEAVDTNFFNELLLSEFDPEGTVLPKEWKDLEKEASSFLESLGTNKKELKYTLIFMYLLQRCLLLNNRKPSSY